MSVTFIEFFYGNNEKQTILNVFHLNLMIL